jgi:hypothetical protein
MIARLTIPCGSNLVAADPDLGSVADQSEQGSELAQH